VIVLLVCQSTRPARVPFPPYGDGRATQKKTPLLPLSLGCGPRGREALPAGAWAAGVVAASSQAPSRRCRQDLAFVADKGHSTQSVRPVGGPIAPRSQGPRRTAAPSVWTPSPQKLPARRWPLCLRPEIAAFENPRTAAVGGQGSDHAGEATRSLPARTMASRADGGSAAFLESDRAGRPRPARASTHRAAPDASWPGNRPPAARGGAPLCRADGDRGQGGKGKGQQNKVLYDIQLNISPTWRFSARFPLTARALGGTIVIREKRRPSGRLGMALAGVPRHVPLCAVAHVCS